VTPRNRHFWSVRFPSPPRASGLQAEITREYPWDDVEPPASPYDQDSNFVLPARAAGSLTLTARQMGQKFWKCNIRGRRPAGNMRNHTASINQTGVGLRGYSETGMRETSPCRATPAHTFAALGGSSTLEGAEWATPQ
jgi:hypothetical protein